MARFRQSLAYAFRSTLTIEQMLLRLNEVGPWKWMARDNDRWGHYVSATPIGTPQRQATVKILIVPDDLTRFAVGLLFESRDQEPDVDAQLLMSLLGILHESVLPAVGADDLGVTEPHE